MKTSDETNTLIARSKNALETSASYLVVVAHPDDEVLGAGGLLSRCAAAGIRATACILSGDVDARTRRPADDDLQADTLHASERLGMGRPIVGNFPNIRMNAVPHLDLVKFVEHAMIQVGATHLVTHHPGDLNDDHRRVSQATQAAARLPQRGAERPPITTLLYMEVPSSTDWAFEGTSRSFEPTAYVPLSPEDLERKLHALSAYRDVMRPVPHPRSTEVLTALAVLRGSTCGNMYAEAFQVAHLRWQFHV